MHSQCLPVLKLKLKVFWYVNDFVNFYFHEEMNLVQYFEMISFRHGVFFIKYFPNNYLWIHVASMEGTIRTYGFYL